MHPDQVRDNLAMIKHPIPDTFWRDLKNEGLLHPEAPVHKMIELDKTLSLIPAEELGIANS